jgi:hypothetical protein
MFVEDQQIDAFFRSQGFTFRIIEDLFERHNINRQEEHSIRIRLSEPEFGGQDCVTDIDPRRPLPRAVKCPDALRKSSNGSKIVIKEHSNNAQVRDASANRGVATG